MDRGEPGVAVVALVGEHESFSLHRLEDTLAAVLDEGCAVVVDLTEATFLDSTTVGVLLQTRDRAARENLGFFMVMDDRTGASVRRMFDVTGLRSVLPIVGTRAEAVGAARG